MMEASFIPVCEPKFEGNEKKYLAECIDSGWVSSEGPFVGKLEAQFAEDCNRSYCCAVSSGTAALDVAIAALGLGPGDEVILPTFTIISCAQAIVRVGATPVLVDMNADTLTMNVDQIEQSITAKTRAIMVVHVFGLPADMHPIKELAQKYNLKIIEDAAEMHGQTYEGKPCGGFGDISIFSLYANKFVTSGEGGLVLTDDEHLYHRVRSLRNLCFSQKKRFVHEELGWNYRMTNLQAAVGLAQLEVLQSTVEKKRHIAAQYDDLLTDVDGLILPVKRCSYAESIYWVYGLVLDEAIDFDADEMIRRLTHRKIGARPYFWPMHEQPVFRNMGLFLDSTHPVSERLARRGFYIPNGLAITGEQIERVAETVRECIKL